MSEALMVDCPRCNGTGKVTSPPLGVLAAAAWEAHKDSGSLRLIHAVKTLRCWTGMGLKDAKDAIEAQRLVPLENTE